MVRDMILFRPRELPAHLRVRTAMLPVLLVLLPVFRTLAAQETAPVIIDYFYQPGCRECVEIDNRILPPIKERFEDLCEVRRHDIGIESNVVKLAAYQQALAITGNEPVCIVVDYRKALNGIRAIRGRLFEEVNEAVALRFEEDWTPPVPILAGKDQAAASPVQDRFEKFTLPAVLAAGLIDGVNPCAFATLVFFMSLLAVSKVRGKKLVWTGIFFCVGSFAAYTALGFGLLRMLFLFHGFHAVRVAVDGGMIAALALLALLSFRDACVYARSGNAKRLTLQLPLKLKTATHAVMRRGLSAGSLAMGGLAVGVGVTALESVCTGQVYVPTLVLVIRSESSPAAAWSYLLAYNVMFVLPLVAVFILTYLGLKTERLLGWSKKNVVPAKILLGCFFLALAVLLAVL